ncbi:MAG: hypothetical protein R3302_09460 [Sulfurimonadaceae bacterium]|nr:hypothetical protein [Sulfurimonadaceae bacterium]
MRLIAAFMIALLLTSLYADEHESEALLGFFAGKYRFIGVEPGSNRAYCGVAEFAVAEGQLNMTRTVRGKSVEATAMLEQSEMTGNTLLRIRFHDEGVDYEESCLYQSDLDNYARISCYLYEQGKATPMPGLEAYFIDLGIPDDTCTQ